MSQQIHPCSPAPLYFREDVGSFSDTTSKFWDVGQCLRYHFLDGTRNQQDTVNAAITTWLVYTNIDFHYEGNPANADIRISFNGAIGSWSAIGTDAKLIDRTNLPTMSLGSVADATPPSDHDFATCLHELGHALGMVHECQSPARGGRIHLNETAAYLFYLPILQWRKDLVKSLVIDQYNLSIVSNHKQMDLKSIMMYFMPAWLNQETIEIPLPTALSDLDKAFVTLIYPPKIMIKNGGMEVATALNIADLPDNLSATILDLISKEKYSEARTAFTTHSKQVDFHLTG